TLFSASFAFLLPFLRRRLLQGFERALDGDAFRQREILPTNILGVLATYDSIEIDDVDRNLAPTEPPGGGKAALTGNERSVRPDHDRMQEAKLRHAGGKQGEIADVAASAFTDDDRVDAPSRHRGAPVLRRRLSGMSSPSSAPARPASSSLSSSISERSARFSI